MCVLGLLQCMAEVGSAAGAAVAGAASGAPSVPAARSTEAHPFPSELM